MEKYFTYLFLLFISIIKINAQKHDKNWVLGLGNIGNANNTKCFIASFDDNGILFKNSNSKMYMHTTNISMSDENGVLQFYTSGSYINNFQNLLIENGNEIMFPNIFANNGFYTEHDVFSCVQDNDHKNIYYLFQDYAEILDLSNDIDSAEVFTKIWITKIDMNANGGLGKVIYKRKEINLQNYYQNEFVRHANGKYWWSIMNNVNGRDYTVLLWDNDSIIKENKISIDVDSIKSFGQGSIQKCISLDGLYYLDLRSLDEIRIFTIDRCNGILKLKNTIKFDSDYPKWGKNWIWGSSAIAMSPNNRYIYLSRSILNGNSSKEEYTYMCQIDLEDSDPWKNRIILKDSFAYTDKITGEVFITLPYKCRYGMDGRLYFIDNSSYTPLYVIQNPNEKGKACNLCDTCISFPYFNEGSLPKYPNYRLGPLKGSPCDTILGVANKDIKPEDYGIKIFPNPSSTIIKIDITIPQYDPTIKTEVVVVDVSGAIVLRHVMPDFAYIAELDISKLPSGVYGVQLRQPQKSGTRVLATEKLVVIE